MKLAKNYIYFKAKECVKLRAKYLNGRGSDCPTYRMLEAGSYICRVIPHIGSKAYCISSVTII